MSKILLLGAMLVVVVSSLPQLPNDYGCQDSKDCGPGGCCVLCYNRYDVPHCEDMRGVGASCRVHDPVNTSVTRYGQSDLQATNIYHLLCPCAEGLICEKTSSTCQPVQ